MRVYTQLAMFLILGAVVLVMGQACGPSPQTAETVKKRVVTNTNNTNGDGGNSTPTPTPAPTATPDPGSTGVPGGGSKPPFGGGGVTANQYGIAEGASLLGQITGEAKNPASPTTPVTVYFFVDGAQGTGMSGGTVVANQPSLGNSGGNTRFIYTLPDQFRNDQMHKLYVYAFINNAYVQLPGSPFDFAAHAPKQAGRDFYAANVQGQLNCTACHAVNYDANLSQLLNRPRAFGGTATNNALNTKGTGGGGHGGGAPCGGACSAAIQQWWAIEYQ